MNLLLNGVLGRGLLFGMVVSMSVCNIPVSAIAASTDIPESSEPEVLSQKPDQKTKTKTEAATAPAAVTRTYIDRDPAGEDEGIDGMTMLYIGGAIGVVALGAVALSGGSGGGSSDSAGALPAPTEPPVGPDLNGTNWGGFLSIHDKEHVGYQTISASIRHSGRLVEILTTSNLHYGQYFTGTISSSGHMLMYDSITGEDWTTHAANATANRVDLYDFVDNYADTDQMLLVR